MHPLKRLWRDSTFRTRRELTPIELFRRVCSNLAERSERFEQGFLLRDPHLTARVHTNGNTQKADVRYCHFQEVWIGKELWMIAFGLPHSEETHVLQCDLVAIHWFSQRVKGWESTELRAPPIRPVPARAVIEHHTWREAALLNSTSVGLGFAPTSRGRRMRSLLENAERPHTMQPGSRETPGTYRPEFAELITWAIQTTLQEEVEGTVRSPVAQNNT